MKDEAEANPPRRVTPDVVPSIVNETEPTGDGDTTAQTFFEAPSLLLDKERIAESLVQPTIAGVTGSIPVHASSLPALEPDRGSPVTTNHTAKTPVAAASLPLVGEELIQSAQEAISDVAIGTPPPHRMLTRGKAIRRSSSGIKSSASSVSRRSSRRDSDSPAPLFASASYIFSSTSTQPAIEELQRSPETMRVGIAHRSSAPAIFEKQVTAWRTAPRGRPEAQSPSGPAGFMQTDLSSTVREPSYSTPSALPPHREAALKRRELALPVSITKAEPDLARPTSVHKMLSGPLIDFTDWMQRGEAKQELPASVASSADLLQLLEEEEMPIAETSAQAAARAAASSNPPHTPSPPIPPKQEASPRPVSIQSSASKKRKTPPPHSAVRTWNPPEGLDGLSRKSSILSTANSPITPMPIHPTTLLLASPTPRPREGLMAMAMPTRRPPPPSPSLSVGSVTDVSAEGTITSDFPPLPRRAPPPAFEPRSGHLPAQSSFNGSTSSSISEKASTLALSAPLWKTKPRTAMLTRPRGPRPPPPPLRRPWARVGTDTFDLEPAPRPLVDRTLSETPLMIDVRDQGPPKSPHRSASAQNLGSQRSAPRSPEYTDLDVLVSRLEGSGREYEASIFPAFPC